MKKLFLPIKDLIFYDLKKLLLIQVFFKLMGILVLYPFFKLVFYFAVKVSGFKYISNTILIEFLLKPSTILLALLSLIIFSIYLVLEYVFLVIFFIFIRFNMSV